jgi:hypothetical protein
MVVADFNVIRVAIFKPETDPPLIVNGDRMLPFPIAFQPMQPIARWISQVIQRCSEIHVLKFARCPLCNVWREPLRLTRFVKLFRAPVSEGLDHPK